MALTDSLVSYWKLDEASGNALDAHGTNDLTDHNTVTSIAGKINNGRHFAAASSEYFSHTTNASLETGDIDFTLSAWAYLDSFDGNRMIISKFTAPPDFEWRVFLQPFGADNARFTVSNTGSGSDGNVTNASGTITTGQWYFVVAWHDSVANTINIQVNDGTVGSTSWSSGVLAAGASDLEIGSDQTGGELMDGIIDEVGFWKRVLTSGERTQLYNSGAGLAYPFSSGARRNRMSLLKVA